MSEAIKRNPNGTYVKGQTGNPGGIPGGGNHPGNDGSNCRMGFVRRLNEALGRGSITPSTLQVYARDKKINPNKSAAASYILAQRLRDGDDPAMIRERARLAADLDDRIEGKPIARMQIDQRVLLQRISAAPGDDRTAAEIAEEIRSFIFAPAEDVPALPAKEEEA